MNKLIQDLQEVIEKKSENDELRQELSSLVKMLKLGFETKPVGMEKVPKIFASNDTKKIKNYFDSFGNQIHAMKLSGQFDSFANYMSVEFGINISYQSSPAPNIQYKQKGKKLAKFKDLYNSYFLEETPFQAADAVTKILKSLDTLTKEFNTENETIKETIKGIIEAQSEHSAETVKTVDRIMTKSRIKAIDLEEVANEVEAKISLQQQAVELVQKIKEN